MASITKESLQLVSGFKVQFAGDNFVLPLAERIKCSDVVTHLYLYCQFIAQQLRLQMFMQCKPNRTS